MIYVPETYSILTNDGWLPLASCENTCQGVCVSNGETYFEEVSVIPKMHYGAAINVYGSGIQFTLFPFANKGLIEGIKSTVIVSPTGIWRDHKKVTKRRFNKTLASLLLVIFGKDATKKSEKTGNFIHKALGKQKVYVVEEDLLLLSSEQSKKILEFLVTFNKNNLFVFDNNKKGIIAHKLLSTLAVKANYTIKSFFKDNMMNIFINKVQEINYKNVKKATYQYDGNVVGVPDNILLKNSGVIFTLGDNFKTKEV